MKLDILKLIGIGFILFFAGFFLKAVGLDESVAGAASPDGIELSHQAADGLTIYAWLSEAARDSLPAGGKPGLALLLPMMSKTHLSYGPFIAEINRLGYSTLAFDMRGHGRSVKAGDKTLSYSSMTEDEFAKMPSDINSCFAEFRALHPEEYDYDNVIVIGASIGANTAALLISEEWVSRVVLLSPGKDYRGLEPGTIMVKQKDKYLKPVYFAASDEDTYAAQSSQWLFENYEGPKIFKKYPGKDHGTSILDNVKDADKELYSWLGSRQK